MQNFSYPLLNISVVSSHTRLWIFFILSMDPGTRICIIYSIVPELDCVLLSKSWSKETQACTSNKRREDMVLPWDCVPKGTR